MSDSEEEPGKRIWIVTGEPGSGKTTIVSKVIFKAKSRGYTVGGVLTREVKSHGQRTGFTLIDVSTDESGVLAASERLVGPRVGKYHVNLKTLASLGVKAMEHAMVSSDFVVCDEIGPMELLSPEFRRSAASCILDSLKPCLCVVHRRLADPFIEQLKTDPASKLFEVSYENRDNLPEEIWGEILPRIENKTPPG